MRYIQLLLVFSLTVVCYFTPVAQQTAIGIHANVNEYLGDLNDAHYDIYKYKYLKPGGSISLYHYLNPSFRLFETVSYHGVKYQTDNKLAGFNADFYNLNLMLKYKFDNGYLLNENAVIAPFMFAGFGATYLKSNQFATGRTGLIASGFQGNIVAGGGLSFRFNKWCSLELSNSLHMPLFDGWDGVIKGTNDMYLQHTIGFVFTAYKSVDSDGDGVSDRRDRCPNTPPGTSVDRHGCPDDTDGDGVLNEDDKCPTVYGSQATSGCPDRDRDGVADAEDRCPDTYGLRRLQGCPETTTSYTAPPSTPSTNYNYRPVKDRDGDGVIDEKDDCPDTYGPASNNGCPVITAKRDRDGDGTIDDNDKCPDTYGPSSNYGCPVITAEVKKRLEFATRGIFFETNSAILKTASYKVLNEIAGIIRQYPDYAVRLEGHTDNVGSDAYNLALSQKRINAVKQYLIQKGIDASILEAKGYGESRPIASNSTEIGRAQNRRVEIALYLR